MSKLTTLISATIFAGIVLAGCASKHPEEAFEYHDSSDAATVRLAEAATSVSESLWELARIQAVATPPIDDKNLTYSEAIQGLDHLASVDWSGPIGPIVQKIATAGDYRLRILGTAPAIPVLININARDERLGDILRDIDYQAAHKATIKVYPDERIVELRYA